MSSFFSFFHSFPCCVDHFHPPAASSKNKDMTPKRINIPKGSTCVTYLAYNLAFVLVTSRVREIVVWSSFGNLSAIGICIGVCVLGAGEGEGGGAG